MKNILLIGKLNSVVKEMNSFLSNYFRVQLCSENVSVLEGMMKIVMPDLVLVSLIGAYDIDPSIFYELNEKHPDTPVLTVGTKEESERFFKYYEHSQFENLIRPVENDAIFRAVCRKLGVDPGTIEGASAQGGGKRRVLVVDDNAATLRTIKAMLEESYEVAVAVSGMQAMTSIGRKRPDLILLDYEMPVCDGRTTLEMIRADEEVRDIPVIFLTGVNDRAQIEAVLSLKPSGYLLKPARKDKLLEAIASVLQP